MDMSVYSDITKYAGRKIMSFYTIAIEGLPGMLLNVDDPIGNFKRKRYPTAFEAYYEQHLVTLEALENGYQQVIDRTSIGKYGRGCSRCRRGNSDAGEKEKQTGQPSP